jgi:hypothetical protein
LSGFVRICRGSARCARPTWGSPRRRGETESAESKKLKTAIGPWRAGSPRSPRGAGALGDLFEVHIGPSSISIKSAAT